MTEDSNADDFDLKRFLADLTTRPGVYRMLGEHAQVIYVGKAKNLKKRVSSYFTRADVSPKTRRLVAQIKSIEVTITHTETEALLLENSLIKSLKPRYNILLRDDKSYPYIVVSKHEDYPRLSFYRGRKTPNLRFFGPYPSAGAARETLNLMQKLFLVRQCEDGFFRNRSRACLQYQIKRCSAPCVGMTTPGEYAEDLHHAVLFLEGKNQEVIDDLIQRMETAAQQLAYERAARYRDQINVLRKIQEKQYVTAGQADVDVVYSAELNGLVCVQVFFIRGGRLLGNKSFFPRHVEDTPAGEVLAAFLPQYYLGKSVPKEIVLSHGFDDQDVVAQALSDQAGHRVSLAAPSRGEKRKWLEMAATNAQHALQLKLNERSGQAAKIEALQALLELDEIPARIECFDISHTMGESTVASCVVFDANGPVKNDYRRFNIDDIEPGDDYAAMRQALFRRYRRLKSDEARMPDILLIDGGKGQLGVAKAVLEELQITELLLVAVAKGPGRKAGLETLFIGDSSRPVNLAPDSPALHLIQQIRDEAHRFAISGHRNRRSKARKRSTLEDIPGMGAKRRQLLLTQFGGLQGVARAGVEDLAKIKGISRDMAQRIYDLFHSEEVT